MRRTAHSHRQKKDAGGHGGPPLLHDVNYFNSTTHHLFFASGAACRFGRMRYAPTVKKDTDSEIGTTSRERSFGSG